MNIAWKICPQIFRDAATLASVGSPQMPRDLFAAATRGRLWCYTTTEGITRYPMAAAQDVSNSLDVLAQLAGSMLVRGPNLWTFVPAGVTDGDVLTWNALTGLPEWKAGGAPGGDVYTPPLASDFPTWVNQLTANCSNATTGPLVLGRPAIVAFPNLTARVRPLKTPPATYRLALRAWMASPNDQECGLVVRDAATGRCLTWNLHKPLGSNELKYGVSQWNTPTSFNLRPISNFPLCVGAPFLQLHDDGVNFYFGWSSDDAEYLPVWQGSRTAWLAAPSHWGFYVGNRSGEYAPSTMAIFHWREI